jgi:hypothetical protein
MSDIKPIRVSDDEYNGCSDEVKRAKKSTLEQEDKKFLKFLFV